jgi:hypothetical protein
VTQVDGLHYTASSVLTAEQVGRHRTNRLPPISMGCGCPLPCPALPRRVALGLSFPLVLPSPQVRAASDFVDFMITGMDAAGNPGITNDRRVNYGSFVVPVKEEPVVVKAAPVVRAPEPAATPPPTDPAELNYVDPNSEVRMQDDDDDDDDGRLACDT